MYLQEEGISSSQVEKLLSLHLRGGDDDGEEISRVVSTFFVKRKKGRGR